MKTEPTSSGKKQPLDLSSLCLAITEHAPLPMTMVEGRPSHIVRYVNTAFCRLMDKSSDQLVGKSFAEMMPPTDELLTLLDRVYRTGKAESHREQQRSEPHSVLRSFTMWPVLADESPVGVMIQVTETMQRDEKMVAMNEALVLSSLRQHELTEAAVSERKQTNVALSESEDRFRAIADNIPQLAWMADGEGRVDWFNRGWLEYTGTTLEENLGVGWKAVHHPDFVDAVAEKFERHLREGRDWEDTFPLRGKDGTYRWFLSRMNVIRDQSGKVTRFFGTNTDITKERKAEERQRLLMNELAHRDKNLLAVIQSIASRSLSGTRSLAEMRDVLTQRILALSRSHSVLLTEGFEGAPVAEIVRLEFEAFSDRVTAVGPDVMMNPKVAQTFALLVHELATNATKYGALSGSDGQVSIQWSVKGAGAEAKFKFQWQERGGPPVVPPTRQGFGRIVLENAAAQEFEAPPKMRFAPDGLSYEIDAPLSVVAAESAGGGATAVLERRALMKTQCTIGRGVL